MLLLARLRGRMGRTLEVDARTFWGEKMHVRLPEEGVSRAIYLWHHYEPGLTRMMLDRLSAGMTFVDVGAHYGYYTLLAARIVGEGGVVHAFDPSPRTFEVLARNVAGRANVRAFNLALYSHSTELVLQDFGPRYSAANTVAGAARVAAGQGTPRGGLRGTPVRVRATTMDEHVAETGIRPDFVKIDAESAEYDILLGMEDTIARSRPMISLEVGDYGLEGVHRSADLVEFLSSRGYEAWEWSDRGLVPHRPRERYQQDNMLFVPSGR
jgi:FkbM family methyltransferase